MPYEIRKKGSEFCVVKKATGQSIGCSPTREQADKHMAALYANEGRSMSYYLADNTGYIRDFASVGGLHRLAAWGAEQDPTIADFFERGYTELPRVLSAALELAKTPDAILEEMVKDLAATARMAQGQLIMSDGTEGDATDEFKANSREITLTIAAGYKTRIEKFEGRDHLVLPVVALMEGVVHAVNAANAEFVPKSELKAQGWDSRPLYLGHPMRDGHVVSGATPDVRAKESIGFTANAAIKNEKLVMEAWVDMARAASIAPELLERVKEDDPIEISVGVFVDTDKTVGEYNGKKYLGQWHGIIPDHLALLPSDSEGACSRKMGCGVRAASALIEPKTLRQISQEERDKIPAEDFAGPNRSFFIVEPEDVHNAAQSLGRTSGNTDTVKSKIISIAYRKGASFVAKLPEDWKKKKDQKNASTFARIMDGLRSLLSPDESDSDQRNELTELLADQEPGLLGVRDVYSDRVIYMVQESGSYCLYEREYSGEAGSYKLSGERTEVEPVTYYEPVAMGAPGSGPTPSTPKQTANRMSSVANHATAKAGATAADHKTAMEAHKGAAEANRKADDAARADYHMGMAAAHETTMNVINAYRGNAASNKSETAKETEIMTKCEAQTKFLEDATQEQLAGYAKLATLEGATDEMKALGSKADEVIKAKAAADKALAAHADGLSAKEKAAADKEAAAKNGDKGGDNGGQKNAEAKVPTFDELLEKADPAVRDSIREGMRTASAKKDATIKVLQDSKRCDYTAEQLKAMSQDELDRLVKLSGATVKAATDFGGAGGPRDNAPAAVPAPPDQAAAIRAAHAKK